MAAHATLSPTTCQELTDPHSPWTDHTFCPDTFTVDWALKSTANHPLAYLGIIGFFVLQPRAKVNLEDRKRSNESEGNTPNQCMWSEGNTPNQWMWSERNTPNQWMWSEGNTPNQWMWSEGNTPNQWMGSEENTPNQCMWSKGNTPNQCMFATTLNVTKDHQPIVSMGQFQRYNWGNLWDGLEWIIHNYGLSSDTTLKLKATKSSCTGPRVFRIWSSPKPGSHSVMYHGIAITTHSPLSI